MGSHSVTCYPTQVNAFRSNPNPQAGNSIYLLQRDERLSWPRLPDNGTAAGVELDHKSDTL